MSKRTVNEAHDRIDDLDARIVRVETQLHERWRETIYRIKRLENIIIGSAASMIALLIAILTKMT